MFTLAHGTLIECRRNADRITSEYAKAHEDARRPSLYDGGWARRVERPRLIALKVVQSFHSARRLTSSRVRACLLGGARERGHHGGERPNSLASP
jgi:hypothetical protein